MKHIYILFLFISSFIIGQNESLTLSMNCYTNGDTIPTSEFSNIKTVELISNNKATKGTYNLYSWKLTITYKNSISITFDSKPNNPNILTKEMIEAMTGSPNKIPKKIHFEEIKTVTFQEHDEIQYGTINNVIFSRGNSNKNCSASSKNSDKNINYKGKLLTGKTEKLPLVDQKVILKDSKNIAVQTTTTDKYGDFNFQTVNTKNSYKIEVASSGPNVKDDQIYIAKQDGSNIRSLKKVGNNFVYELLPIELTKLSEEKIDDTKITLKDFSSSAKKELTVTKDVYYKVNSADITNDSRQVLDDIIKSLQENKSLKLSIISHTDSQGDDNSNLQLSEKRAKNVMTYILSKGIEKGRLSSKGMGETKIINRCKNGIDCSEEEHKLNRRTEFIFSK